MREKQEDWKAAVLLVVAVLLGVAVGAAIMPVLFGRIETDLLRTKTLLNTADAVARGKLPGPDTIVLGDSVTMNGVDTQLVTDELPARPVVYNFSSTAQSIAEAYLYLQALPARTRSVVLVMVPTDLETSQVPAEDVLNAFYLYGYRPTTETVETLESVFGPERTEFLRASEFRQRFQGRWAVAQAVDTLARKALRPDLKITRSAESLTYPSPYTKRIGPAAFEKLLPRYNRPRPSAEFSPHVEQIALLRRIAEQLQTSERRLAIVLAPMHPRRLAFLGPHFASSLKQFVASGPLGGGVRILDLSELLPEDCFIDVVHPTRAGAVTISHRIAEFLLREGA